MLTSEFDYDLPPELIAQEPVEPRDASRLLVVHRDTDLLEHRHFADILEYLRPGDLLVANETRVIPARLHARKIPSGGKVELLLLSRQGNTTWEALVKGRRVGIGQRLEVSGSADACVEGVVRAITRSGGRLVAFDQPIAPHLREMGTMPLPPYIHRPLDDAEKYQTVYSRVEGSAAAPTAGLHFTPQLLRRIRAIGVEWETVLLHIGLDTFRPVSEDRVEDHTIHTEYCCVTSETAERVTRAKREGRRVIAVGTTSVRVLESAARDSPPGIRPWDGPTDLFIYPGYHYRVVDALITNFHLPRSSLLMLVSAFMGLDRLRRAYGSAIRERYRFYSFGDSMLIL